MRGQMAAALSVLAIGGVTFAACGGGSTGPTGSSPTQAPSSSVETSLAGAKIASTHAVALLGGTQVGFTMAGVQGTSLRCSWDFGDGAEGVGLSVTHLYSGEGIFKVVGTVSDGSTSVTANASITVRSLTGRWSATDPSFHSLELSQRSPAITGSFQWGAFAPGSVGGRVNHPLVVRLVLLRPGQFQLEFTGNADAALDNITGSYALCMEGGGGCSSATPVTFRRQ